MLRILDRYIVREVLGAWLAFTLVLMVLLVTSQFSKFIGYAASGELPADVVFKLLALTCMNYLILIVPPALFLATLFALGRMYRDNEMAAIRACGVGDLRLYRPLLTVGIFLAGIVALLSLVLTPYAAKYAYQLKEEAKQSARLGLIEAGKFKSLGKTGATLYVEKLSKDGEYLENLFVYHEETGHVAPDDSWQFPVGDPGIHSSVVTAKRGFMRVSGDNTARTLVLENGYRYEGTPGEAGYQVVKFAEHGVYFDVEQPQVTVTKRSALATSVLLESDSLADKAELQWRIALPVAVIVLMLLALPLGKIKPRQGRYARLFLGVLGYLIYFNLLGVVQLWIEDGKWPPNLGMWPVHGLVLLVTINQLRRHGAFNRVKIRALEASQ
jgi:lipopolysaccharide export system permease protein